MRFLRRFPIFPKRSDSRTVKLKDYRKIQLQRQQQDSIPTGALENVSSSRQSHRVTGRKGHALSRSDIRQKSMWYIINAELSRNHKLYDEFMWSQNGEHRCGMIPELDRETIETCGWGASDGTQELNECMAEMERTGRQIEDRLDVLGRERIDLGDQLKQSQQQQQDKDAVQQIRLDLAHVTREIHDLDKQLLTQYHTLCHYKSFVAKSHILLEKSILYGNIDLDGVHSTGASIESGHMHPMGRTSSQTIHSHVLSIVQHYCPDGTDSAEWKQFLNMYEKARFSNEEISREEYVRFIRILTRLIRSTGSGHLNQRATQQSFRSNQEDVRID